jgi:hypothetical protein
MVAYKAEYLYILHACSHTYVHTIPYGLVWSHNACSLSSLIWSHNPCGYYSLIKYVLYQGKYFFIFILSRFYKTIWSVTNFAKIYICRRGPRRQGHNIVAPGGRSRQEWALAWPRRSTQCHGVRGLAPWATASGPSAMAHGGSRPPNTVAHGARVQLPI